MFFLFHFLIKDLPTRMVFYKGMSEKGLYSLSLGLFYSSSGGYKAFSFALPSSMRGWDILQLQLLNKPLQHSNINFINNISTCCHACSFSKSSRLPFPTSNFHTSTHLELVCSDIWGVALIYSINVISYYVLF